METKDVATEEILDRAAAFKALGDPTRLRIFEFLCTCCRPVDVDESGEVRPIEGPTAGEVCCRVTGVDRITSTVSFHLKELRQAGLITMERRGKRMVCAVRPEALQALKAYLHALTGDTACETAPDGSRGTCSC